MKSVLFAMLVAGGVFGIVVAVAPAREAKADPITEAADYCLGNFEDCREAAVVAYDWADSIWNWVDDAFTGISYLEECIGEGCSTEEVREAHVAYHEEAINENGYYEEVKETVFHDNHRASLNDAQENAFVLVMLKDFQRRGWAVRSKDIVAAGG